MSWQLGSVLVIGLALAGGFLWYERSRPPSQVVALVAVLAALAVAGRIVLAPVPNVVATTDIVIIAGYVLGPAPGFAVGAFGALISNFWLGQGIWTPWQMLAWGACGVGGAVLWRVTGGRAGRFSLAFTCGLAGILFGAWMNLQTLVSYGGDLSLERYLLLETRAIPFDVAHTVGNVLFALLVGPAMIAALLRFRERFDWRAVASHPVAVLLLVTVAIGPALAPADPAAAAVPKPAKRAAQWLRGQQNPDGGFSLYDGQPSSIQITTRAMMALAAGGINPLDVKRDGHSPYDALVARRSAIKEANDLALTIVALRAVNRNPRSFSGRNLVNELVGKQQDGGFFLTEKGGWVRSVNGTAWAVVALRSAGRNAAAARAVEWLVSVQHRQGGWGMAPGSPRTPDSTGAALMALRSGGGNAVRQGVRYLRQAQKSSGGFFDNGSVNSQSTAIVATGLIRAGQKGGILAGALRFLRQRQAADGSVSYSKQSDQTPVWVTADAGIALGGRALPVGAPKRAPKPKPKPPGKGSSGSSGSTGSSGSSGTAGSTASSGSSGATRGSTGGVTRGNDGSGKAGSNGDRSVRSGGTQNGNGSDRNGTDGSQFRPDENGELTGPPTPEAGPVVPSAALVAASAAAPPPSLPLAVLIGLGVTTGLAGGTVLLVRRRRW